MTDSEDIPVPTEHTNGKGQPCEACVRAERKANASVPTERTIQDRCREESAMWERSEWLGTTRGLISLLREAASALDAAEAAKDAAYEEVAAENTRANEAEARIAELEARADHYPALFEQWSAAEARLEAQGKLLDLASCYWCGGITDRELGFWGDEDTPASLCPDTAGYHAARTALDALEAK